MDMRCYQQRLRPHSQQWFDQIFACRAAETGGIIKRQVIDVEKEVGVGALVAEVRRRRFRLIQTNAHFVIVCDPGPIDLMV